eukprot:XP_014772152.1 PREDICTED: cytochrome P450 2B4-like [Octopus bimaculoides]
MDISALYFTENVNIQTLLLGLVILLIIQWLVARSKYNYDLPPGPIAFPIIGNLPQMIYSTDLYLKIEDLRKQYGDIFRLKVGSDTFVFVCKTEMILEGLVQKGDQLKGICNWVYIFDKVFQRKGVSFNSGKEWKDLRRFITSTFRDLGVGKRNTEKKIYLETLTLGEFFESHNGKPFSLSTPMSYYSLIIIYSIIFGERIAFGAPEIMEILENLKFFFKHVNAVVPENFFPFLRFFRWNSPIENLIKKRKKLRSYVKNKITEHKETFNAENIRDFIDIYLLSLEKEPNNESLSALGQINLKLESRKIGVIQKVDSQWASPTVYGIPDIIVSDNGTQFTSDEFRKFCKMEAFSSLDAYKNVLELDGLKCELKLFYAADFAKQVSNIQEVAYIIQELELNQVTKLLHQIVTIPATSASCEKSLSSKQISLVTNNSHHVRPVARVLLTGEHQVQKRGAPSPKNGLLAEEHFLTLKLVRRWRRRRIAFSEGETPISPPHAAEVDTTLGGYDIPKNTVLSYMLINAHFDPKYWDNPKEFRPERWIEENNELKKNEAFMPFSLGPRVCPALALANTETFITFTNIIQKFQLDKPDENPMTIDGKQSGITYVPVNDNIRAIPL